MKVYLAALIDKPLRRINQNLRIKIGSDLKKSLQVKGKAIKSQELNSFIFILPIYPGEICGFFAARVSIGHSAVTVNKR